MPVKKKNKSLYGGVSSSQFLHQSPLLLNLLSQVSLGRGDKYVPPPRRKVAVSENLSSVLNSILGTKVSSITGKPYVEERLPPLPPPAPLPPLPILQPLEPVVHQSMPQLTSPPVYMGSMQPSNQHIFNEYEIGPRRYELEKWKVLHRDEVQKEKLLKKKEALDLKQEKQKGDLKLKELGKRGKVLRTKLTKLKKMYK